MLSDRIGRAKAGLSDALRRYLPGLQTLDPAKVFAGVASAALFTAILTTHLHPRQSAARPVASSLAPITVPVTVGPGDTLWSLARRYGNPNADIQDRVDNLVEANRLSATQPLIPGQRLQVRVENPVELAQLHTVVASR